MIDQTGPLAQPRAAHRPQWGGLFPETLFKRLEQDPPVGEAVAAIGDMLLERADGRMLEFVALRSSAVRGCLYMWVGHSHIALQRQPEPLTAEEIARVAAGPAALTGADAALLTAIDELLFDRQLSAHSVQALGERGLILRAAVLFYETIAGIVGDSPPEEEPIRGLETPAVAARSVGGAVAKADFVLIAGPCSVWKLGRMLRVALAVRDAGATMLRGGAFKPRTAREAFQGLGEEALAMLAEAKARTGLPVVTELLDVRDLEAVLAVADMVQVGARNMTNTPLLKALADVDRPVLLKRGFAATIDETLKAAEYVTGGGKARVVLCERGIRTFETAYRFTLDLTAVPILQERSGLPVIVDPSHAAGRRDLVTSLSKAAVAVGADGLIVEVDEDPDSARSDPLQQLPSPEFADYVAAVRQALAAEGRQLQAPPAA
jgi:3-deoxy-7-phosphoheptulonate synthase